MIAKWKNQGSTMVQVSELRWERQNIVEVEIPFLGVTIPVYVPSATQDITAYLQSSKELKAQVKKYDTVAEPTEFDLLLAEEK